MIKMPSENLNKGFQTAFLQVRRGGLILKFDFDDTFNGFQFSETFYQII